MSFSTNLKIAGALALVLAVAGCKWTSEAPLLTDNVLDKSPLKPGTYAHGDTTYKIEGKGKGPIVVTTRSEGATSDTTYSVKFDKLVDKTYLVQAVSGSDVVYEIIKASKDGFVEYRPTCENADKTIAMAAGAVSTKDDNTCKFPTYEALRKASLDAVATISRGEPGFAGDNYIRQQ